MNDTPETAQQAVGNIGFYSCATVPADFARRLERERDEAREDLQFRRELYALLRNEADRLEGIINDLRDAKKN